MRNKKEKNIATKIFIAVGIIIAVLGVAYVGYSLYISNQIRTFDTHMQVLYNEVSVAFLEKDGERVRLDEEGIAQVTLFPRRFSRTVETGEGSEVIDSFKVSMVHGDGTEVLTYERYSEDVVYISLTQNNKTVGYFYKTNSTSDYDDLIESITK